MPVRDDGQLPMIQPALPAAEKRVRRGRDHRDGHWTALCASSKHCLRLHITTLRAPNGRPHMPDQRSSCMGWGVLAGQPDDRTLLTGSADGRLGSGHGACGSERRLADHLPSGEGMMRMRRFDPRGLYPHLRPTATESGAPGHRRSQQGHRVWCCRRGRRARERLLRRCNCSPPAHESLWEPRGDGERDLQVGLYRRGRIEQSSGSHLPKPERRGGATASPSAGR
jgi:hypothetical protein